ncbi:hypothetical protein [Roseomonas indoligenes]|uniref:Uncharacterized protein n=1 Tax=Roseomonas indoligenes TaxID=2820811 RepID=A0A940S4L1_9PROT|nr:hypothetical protein [Pararoseomonas indoligenes]MBP0492089.1 hypothetical protein [Pararoseomonas indoligenes]
MSDALAPAADPVVPPGRPGIGQLIVTVVSPLLLILMLVALIFIQIPPENRDMFNIALGAVIGWNTAVVGYHIGSSAGSAARAATLDRVIGGIR